MTPMFQSMPHVTFGIIVLNGMPFLEYNLKALYPFAHQIIVVEGAVNSASSLASKEGHSTDGTLEMLKHFKAERDPEDKLLIVTAEDEGKENGFWVEKDEMSQAYAKHATGNWLWQIDADEFYIEKDMRSIFRLLTEQPELSGISFPFLQFWGSFASLEDGQYFRYNQPCVHRLFRWGRGYRYTAHRPPTIVDEHGRNLRSLNWISYRQTRRMGIYMYHYSYVLPKQAKQKVGYYANATWSDVFRDNERWLKESYYLLKDPYYIGETGRQMPQWLERYRGPHPYQIMELQKDLLDGQIKEEVRPTEDIDKLLDSKVYFLGKLIFGAILFIRWNSIHRPLFFIKKSLFSVVGYIRFRYG